MQKDRKKQQYLQRLKMLKTRMNKRKTRISAGFSFVMPYHCRFSNPRLKNVMCKLEFFVLF